ncbi:hypothetical protein Bca101_086319 [Brassica carinata]
MAKSKSKKKGKLNSQPSSPHIDIGGEMTNRSELRCGEDDATASRSELRCGEDDGTASRSEIRCGEDATTSSILIFTGARSYASERPKDYNLLGNVKPRFSNQH